MTTSRPLLRHWHGRNLRHSDARALARNTFFGCLYVTTCMAVITNLIQLIMSY